MTTIADYVRIEVLDRAERLLGLQGESEIPEGSELWLALEALRQVTRAIAHGNSAGRVQTADYYLRCLGRRIHERTGSPGAEAIAQGLEELRRQVA